MMLPLLVKTPNPPAPKPPQFVNTYSTLDIPCCEYFFYFGHVSFNTPLTELLCESTHRHVSGITIWVVECAGIR
jgi:hypothetical protein